LAKQFAVKGAGLQQVQLPPGNWFAPPGSNRGGSGGNKAVSYGTNDTHGAKGQKDWGVDAKAFLQGESAKGRQTDLLKLNITPEQEKTLQQHLDSNNPNAQCAAPYSIPEGNSCVDQVQNPLIDTGILQVPTQIQVDPYNKCSHYATALNLNYKANPASCRDTDTAGESKTGFWHSLWGTIKEAVGGQ
jgi:hypothetical protein